MLLNTRVYVFRMQKLLDFPVHEKRHTQFYTQPVHVHAKRHAQQYLLHLTIIQY